MNDRKVNQSFELLLTDKGGRLMGEGVLGLRALTSFFSCTLFLRKPASTWHK